MLMSTLAILPLLFSLSAQAEDLSAFEARIYTPHQVIDPHSAGPKGAVQLLWQKMGDNIRYEVEIDNGDQVYSSITERHYFHTMLYWERDYRWRVRSVGAKHSTDFSDWQPVRVLSKGHQRQLSSERDAYVRELNIDQGG
jgi:hypothetical protein